MESIKVKAKEFLSYLIRNMKPLKIFEQENAIIQDKINSVSPYHVPAMFKVLPLV